MRPRPAGGYHSIAAAAALALAGCAAAAPAPAAPDPTLSAADIQRLLADVQAIRGLRARSPLAIEELDEERFSRAIEARPGLSAGARADRMQTALSFAGADPGSGQRAQRILHEQLLGFYEQGSGKVYLRGGARAGDHDLRLLTLAHEIQHALQDQSFGSLGLPTLLDEDRRLARLALLEGDATVTGVAFLATRQGIPVRRAVVRLARAARLSTTDEVIGETSAELRRAPAVERERLAFPYIAGAGLAAELYRAGGFPLVDRAFARPPDTSEQVLHPDRYVAGEQAIPVRAPRPPRGWTAIAAGRMGELQTRALLLPCIGWARAAQAAEGWGGDAFTVLSSPEGARAALWSTAWDTEADAVDFERAISASHACLPALGFEAAPTAPARVVRDGARVAVALALPPAQLAPAATALLELPEPPLPLAPPVGEVTLPPLAPALRPSLGALRGSAYASAWLGLAALVPQGFSARVGHEGTELFMERPGALGLFGLSDRIVSPQANERLLDELAAGFAAGAEVTLVPSQTMSYSLPIGAVIARRWEIPNTSAQLAVVIAPICWDTGAYVFLTMSATPEDQAALDAWLLSFRATTPAPPVCAELAPE